jgi:hypothetical protein
MKNSMQKSLALLFFIIIGLTPILTILALNVPKWIFKDDFAAQEYLTTILVCVELFIMFTIGMVIAIKAWKNENKYWRDFKSKRENLRDLKTRIKFRVDT